jgi:hypothetical protein
MNRIAVLIAALLATSSFGAAPEADAPTAEQILSGEAPPGEYVKKETCIVSTRIKRTEVLSERFVLFHLFDHGELWLARLPQRCSGLTPRSKLMFDKSNADRLCQWDGLKTIQQEETSMPQFGPRCVLPVFEAITPDQVEQLKKEIASARYRTPKPPKQ